MCNVCVVQEGLQLIKLLKQTTLVERSIWTHLYPVLGEGGANALGNGHHWAAVRVLGLRHLQWWQILAARVAWWRQLKAQF